MNGRVPVEQALNAYLRFYQELRPETVSRLDRLAVPDVHFKDPFNDFRSRDRMKQVFARMFQRVEQPRFIIRDHAISEQMTYLRWGFSFRTAGAPRPTTIEGMSEVKFDMAGQVTSHIDHWDAAEQFYERLPVLGWVLRQIKARMAD
ncbi:nuclear transport factor 2 family protein [Niveispirillum sp. SYP-B3756]|uniref:nuclear transport factor 2 family protein n=1 Tax=Niveispirillum sp. SYP-B3756 TaxID=2662178 RepID=UPI0012909A7E|nr:nuclear transport factor 2 family protein [Niveispirillum sp. SYP-B3756]MQP66656.1 nuclear transport factor 2 family protein [Niveispirillum sp. SYP-B3756]